MILNLNYIACKIALVFFVLSVAFTNIWKHYSSRDTYFLWYNAPDLSTFINQCELKKQCSVV